MSDDDRRRWSDGPWEEPYGYSRVLRVGPHVHVAGTTAAPMGDPPGRLPTSPADQTWSILRRVGAALGQVGASVDDVVRTRIYVVEGVDPVAVMAVHGEVFARARPAASLVVVRGLLLEEMLVEIEADAFVS
jgi:enamine deaminase RidA (YjgF/YER057c/UK114 family)